MSNESLKISFEQARKTFENALVLNGTSRTNAVSVALSIVEAEFQGKPKVGLLHGLDYLDALHKGRVNGTAIPDVQNPTPVLFHINANQGFPHPAFEALSYPKTTP